MLFLIAGKKQAIADDLGFVTQIRNVLNWLEDQKSRNLSETTSSAPDRKAATDKVNRSSADKHSNDTVVTNDRTGSSDNTGKEHQPLANENAENKSSANQKTRKDSSAYSNAGKN